MSNQTTDFLVIGGGIIGINMALNAKQKYPNAKVILIEKEANVGLHASGRNSGVLHAGFYYTADSLKAKFTREGNLALTRYCEHKKLKINHCGKLVVAKNESELQLLQVLLDRGNKNDVDVELITEKKAKKIEPRVKTFHNALYSPTTSSIDPVEVVHEFYKDAVEKGIHILPNTKYINKTNTGILTNSGNISAGYIINAAGLYADKIAKDFGFCQKYTIVPFKGLYLVDAETKEQLKTHIYPVPNLANPFLGIHFTVTVDGMVKVGPTAIPAFWREQYRGMDNFNFQEFLEITGLEAGLFIRNDFNFRALAFNELAKYKRLNVVKMAKTLVNNIEPGSFSRGGKVGIRAQLLNTTTKQLEMDFIFEGGRHSFHILNSVSPAFTCSIPFTQYLFDQIEILMHK